MKNQVIVLAGIILASCNGPQNQAGKNTNTADSILVSRDLCFRQVSGAQNKDTLQVSLHIAGTQVMGVMSNAIFEKDARRGQLNGTLAGDTIHAVWEYQQEGSTDTTGVDMILAADHLMQRVSAAGQWEKVPQIKCNEGAATAVPASNLFKASGTLEEITPGKDGFMATLKSDDGTSYAAVFSIIRLERAYKALKAGDKVAVAGDTIHLGDQVSIQVREFSVK